MGSRRSLAFTVLLIAAAPFAVLSAPPPSSKLPPIKPAAPGALSPAKRATKVPVAPVTSATPASSASSSAPASSANAGKSAEAEFAKLKAVNTKPGDPKAGKAKAVACGACHGPTGNSTSTEYPKLAGQNPRYIVTQLMRFKTGLRKNAIMQGMAASLSPQDMRDIGAYFAEQKPVPGTADEKLAKEGGQLYREGDAKSGIPACMACHGPAGRGNPGWRVPRLAGQHAAYIEKQLQAWHDGASWGTDQHAKIMPAIAQLLTEKDISAVASYIEGLHAAPAPNTSTAPNIID